MTDRKMTVGRYLVRRLEQLGLKHAFGVPGDYVLTFLDLLEESSIDLVNTCNELNAGYAADGYARVTGLGAVCITYGVGGFSAYNAVAGAFAERIPLVVISGGPKLSLRGRLHPNLLHHTIGDMNLQRDIFDRITQAAIVLRNPVQALRQIDETLAVCVRHSRPVYIEIPADMVDEPCEEPGSWTPDRALHLDADVLAEAVEETLSLMSSASSPVILAGVEVCRLNTQEALLEVVERTGYPVATTALGKGVIPEHTNGYIGTYFGALANESTRRIVEASDLVLCLGAWTTDIDLGGYTAHLDPGRLIVANNERVWVKRHVYDHVPLKDFLAALCLALSTMALPEGRPALPLHPPSAPFVPSPPALLSADRFWARINRFIADDHILVVDTGSSAFEGLKLCLPAGADYVSQCFYASIGFAIPATLGIKLAAPRYRPIVFVGDGAFQMTGQELSTIIRRNLNPVIFLVNNDGYQVERVIYDNVYNDLQRWEYALLPEAYGGKRGVAVRTEGDLEAVLRQAAEQKDALVFADVRLKRDDFSETLRRLGETLR